MISLYGLVTDLVPAAIYAGLAATCSNNLSQFRQ